MYDEERYPKRRLYVASFSEDVPNESNGLIPRRALYSAPHQKQQRIVWYQRPVFLVVWSFFFLVLGVSATNFYTATTATNAAVSMSVPFTPEPFTYGLPYAHEHVPADVIDEYIAVGTVFVLIDYGTRSVEFYEQGALQAAFSTAHIPDVDSWWFAPAGAYTVTDMHEKTYSEFANIHLPWSIQFGENFFIHGTPHYPNEEPLPSEFEGGGVTLGDQDAAQLFAAVASDTLVIVREPYEAEDAFVYETNVPNITAVEYLVADIENSTVLAASDLDAVVPIASLTKLMTALVAAEHIALDQSVSVHGTMSDMVITLIPRLEHGHRVSMYELLQLLLSESSNEAAEVIARVLGRDTFIALMNEKAAELNLTQSTFTDPSGLDDGNVSSVGDLFRIVQYIHDNRGFILELTRDQSLPTAYTDGQFGRLANFNDMENVHFVAGKVGETDAAGQTSATLHSITVKGEERLVAVVVLGSTERTADVERLISFVEERFGE